MILIQAGVFMRVHEKQKRNVHSKNQRLVLVPVTLLAVVLIPSFTKATSLSASALLEGLAKGCPSSSSFQPGGFKSEPFCTWWVRNTRAWRRAPETPWQRGGEPFAGGAVGGVGHSSWLSLALEVGCDTFVPSPAKKGPGKIF